MRKGKFTNAESKLLKISMESYSSKNKISIEMLCHDCINRSKLRGAWLTIAECLPERSVESVYRHGIRLMHKFKRGPWSDVEIEMLEELVEIYGPKWKVIQNQIGRIADACRDKYRERKQGRSGRWREDEEIALVDAIREHLQINKDVMLNCFPRVILPWNEISQKVGSRSRVSCINKWEGLKNREILQCSKGIPREIADLRMIIKIMESEAKDESEITWSKLSHPLANSRFRALKKTIPDCHVYDFQDLLRLMANTLRMKLSKILKGGSCGCSNNMLPVESASNLLASQQQVIQDENPSPIFDLGDILEQFSV